MPCGCGGGASRYPTTTQASAAAGSYADPQEWVVTFSDGRQQAFDSDTEAYRALRLRGGGGVQQRNKVS